MESSSMNESSHIPSEKDFERASRRMREKARSLDVVREAVLKKFGGTCLHEFFILDQRDVDFRSYVFFKDAKDLEESTQRALDQEIIRFVYQELERVGRGSKNNIEVAFEFDSHENVKIKYGGDYYLRLR